MTQLKRSISYPLLTLYGLGTILGAGIYVLVGKVAASAALYAPLSFILAAVIAGLSGYSYAAMSARYPKSAGEVNYVQASFAFKPLAVIVGVLVVLTGVVSAATLANGFVGYVDVFIKLPPFFTISVLVGLMTALAAWGVSQSIAIAALITLIEIGGLLWVVGYNVEVFNNFGAYLTELRPLSYDYNVWFGILAGSFLAFYAFIGFEDMVNMAEETTQAEKTMPKAIISALIISAVLYILIAVIAVLALPLETLANSNAPMAAIMKTHSDQAYTIISLISLIAIINGVLVQIIMGARVLYGMSSAQLLPHYFKQINLYSKTPLLATLIIGLITWLFAILLPLVALAQLTSFIIIIVFLFVNIALIITLKKEQQTPKHVMSVSIWVPWVASLLSAAFLLARLALFFWGNTT